MRVRRLLPACLVTVACLVALAAPAYADTTLYTPWSSLLPGWNDQFAPGSDNDCAAGRPSCLNVTLNEQTHILNHSKGYAGDHSRRESEKERRPSGGS